MIDEPQMPSQPNMQEFCCPGESPGETDLKEIGQSCPPRGVKEGDSIQAAQPSCASLGPPCQPFLSVLISFPYHILQLLSHTCFLPEALISVPSLPREPNTHRAIHSTTSPPPSPVRLCREQTGARCARPPGR